MLIQHLPGLCPATLEYRCTCRTWGKPGVTSVGRCTVNMEPYWAFPNANNAPGAGLDEPVILFV